MRTQRFSSRVQNTTLALLLLAACSGVASAQGGVHPSSNQVPLEEPLTLYASELDVRITVPGYDPIEFQAAAIDLPGYPESLLIPASPLGVGALLRDPTAERGEYLIDFEFMGVPTFIAWDGALGGSMGSTGSLVVEVRMTPAATAGSDLDGPPSATQGPGDPPNVSISPAKDGDKDGVRISIVGSAECLYEYVQFVSVTVTWEGTGPDGKKVSGTGCGPVSNEANGGKDMASDGSKTYVDAPNLGGSGAYPDQGHDSGPGANEVTQHMADAPSLNDPKPFVDAIEADDRNAGVTVTSITLTQRFTAYVYEECPPADAEVVAKVEWSRSQTVEVDPQTNEGPAGGPGGFGGPAAGPSPAGSPFTQGQPSVQPVGELDPEHEEALNGFKNGESGGATVNGW